MIAALIDIQTNVVINLIKLSTKKDYALPGTMIKLIENDSEVSIEWSWDGEKFIPPYDPGLEASIIQAEEEAYQL